MSVNSKMTAIANEIRELSGATQALTLDAMATNLGEANSNVSMESNLISQIASALEGKAGGNSEGAVIKTFTFSGDSVSSGSGANMGLSINPFIEGMTWQEFINSPLNYVRYSNILGVTQYTTDGTYVQFPASLVLNVTTNGTSNTRVSLHDKIIATQYVSWVDSGFSGQ